MSDFDNFDFDEDDILGNPYGELDDDSDFNELLNDLANDVEGIDVNTDIDLNGVVNPNFIALFNVAAGNRANMNLEDMDLEFPDDIFAQPRLPTPPLLPQPIQRNNLFYQEKIREFIETPDGESPKECPICYEPHGEMEILRCGHIFHQQCLNHWRVTRDFTCPMCRQEIIRQQLFTHANIDGKRKKSNGKRKKSSIRKKSSLRKKIIF